MAIDAIPNCGICLNPLDGRHPEINHGEGAPPAHAIHRECLYPSDPRQPVRQLTCLFRCPHAPRYIDQPVLPNLAAELALRVHHCMVCHGNLQIPNPQLGPLLAHRGKDQALHAVHTKCMKSRYIWRGNLNCLNCEKPVSDSKILTAKERNLSLLISKIIAFVVNGAFTAIAAIGIYLLGNYSDTPSFVGGI